MLSALSRRDWYTTPRIVRLGYRDVAVAPPKATTSGMCHLVSDVNLCRTKRNIGHVHSPTAVTATSGRRQILNALVFQPARGKLQESQRKVISNNLICQQNYIGGKISSVCKTSSDWQNGCGKQNLIGQQHGID